MNLRTLTALFVATALATAACGGGDDEDAAPRATTTSAAPAPTEPPAPPADIAPLTGLPQPDAARRNRPLLVVKIDNAPKARPPVGLNAADVVIQEKVEDGVTRFLAMYHSNDADPVGPVRSARSTDIALLIPLHRPLYAFSGTNATFQRQLQAAPIVDLQDSKVPSAYRRQSGRSAPYNLFSSTSALYRNSDSRSTAPPPLFRFRAGGQAAGGEPAKGVHMEFRGKNITTITDYAWDASSGTWKRSQDGGAHVDSAGAQVAPRNVIVQLVEYVNTGQVDTSGAAVPEADLIGDGEAWILTDGKVVKGRWSKPSPEALTSYTGPDGQPVLLTPGQTWIELPPIGSARLT